MRQQLRARLSEAWPDLRIVAEAKNGLQAVEAVRVHSPHVVFLDIRMPGVSGIEAAKAIAQLERDENESLPAIVFVTAYDSYAIAAFEQGAVDYVLKPAEVERLAKTVIRLRDRLATDEPSAANLQGILHALGAHVTGRAPRYIEFVQASVGATVHVIAVSDVLFFASDEKYTRVQTARTEALIRKPIKDLVDELDPYRFWQIHRSTIVNAGAIAAAERDERGRLSVRLRDHSETLPVSRAFAGLFRGM